MDAICQELGIPRKQIKETKRPHRFIVIVHKSWLKSLVQDSVFSAFPNHPGFDEWPTNEESIGKDWSLTYFTVTLIRLVLLPYLINIYTPFNSRFIKSSHTKLYLCRIAEKITPTQTLY